MAFTFEDLGVWWKGKSYPIADLTLVVTQEDGRTMYAQGFFNNYNSSTHIFSGQFQELFSDRTRALFYGPPSPSLGPYQQPFDRNNGVDLANFQFKKVAPNSYEGSFTLLNWGNVVITLNLSIGPQAKIYFGWGQTIGQGTGLALYALSINGAIETPG